MKLRARRPNGDRHRRLVNRSALGRVCLDATGVPAEISLLLAEGGKSSAFPLFKYIPATILDYACTSIRTATSRAGRPMRLQGSSCADVDARLTGWVRWG